MKKVIIIFTIIFFAGFAANGQQPNINLSQNSINLAIQYYNSGDYEKAAPLFLDVYQTSQNRYYFRLYTNALAQQQKFKEAEDAIKNEIKKSKDDQADLIIQWGYLLKFQKKEKDAESKYKEAMKLIVPKNRNSYISMASLFIQWAEYEWAEKVYKQGEKDIPSDNFYGELANVYLYMRDFTKMLDQLLELIKLSDTHLQRVQSNLTSALYLDADNSYKDQFRTTLLKRIQSEPDVIGYNRLFVWFLLQEKQYAAALRQLIALDRRTGTEEAQILSLARSASNNQSFKDASAAYDYILEKGKSNNGWEQAYINKMHSDFLYYTQMEADDKEEGRKLAQKFEKAFAEMGGYKKNNTLIVREYAHLLAFYLEENELGITVIDSTLRSAGLHELASGELKTELADIYLRSGDPWEATILYTQVIDAYRNNALADEVKLKKARLGYYMGNFGWAKAQLDALKASTSKLTANDAMELSLFIADNLTDDDDEALQSFARADFSLFQKKDSEAMAILDSIEMRFTENSLIDDILYRKANIFIRQNQPETAVPLLTRIANEFPEGLLADDALFLLGETYEFKLSNNEKAAKAYKRVLFEHPGSIYATDARKRYRELNGEPPEIHKPTEEPPIENETIIFDGKI